MDKSANIESVEPGQSVEIDFFRPGDAAGVSKLFRTVYGEGYPVKAYLQPEILIAENASGKIISTVARTSKGDIIGHVALYCSAYYKGVRECGAGLVHPAYRNFAGVFVKMITHSTGIAAAKYHVEVIQGEPVCNHIITQKYHARNKVITCAVEVDLMPADAYVKEKSAAGRVATLLGFKTLIPKQCSVFLPVIYKDILDFLYDSWDDRRELNWCENDEYLSETTVIDCQFFEFAMVARLSVTEIGKDFTDVFLQAEQAFLKRGAAVIQVFLKNGRPWMSAAIISLREKGYFIGGILPRWFDEDGLLMQKIIGRPNWEDINIYLERDKKLLQMVQEDWQRTL